MSFGGDGAKVLFGVRLVGDLVDIESCVEHCFDGDHGVLTVDLPPCVRCTTRLSIAPSLLILPTIDDGPAD